MAVLRSYKAVRLSLVRERTDAPYLSRSGCVAQLARAVLHDDPREGMLAVYLDNRHRVMAVHRVSIGTCDAAPCNPREVFGPALLLACAKVVVAHNHPSGCCMPSGEDRSVTDRLRRAGEVVGVELLDHVVLGDVAYYSFAEECSHPWGSP